MTSRPTATKHSIEHSAVSVNDECRNESSLYIIYTSTKIGPSG